MNEFHTAFVGIYRQSPRVSNSAYCEYAAPVDRFVDEGAEPYCYSVRLVDSITESAIPRLVQRELSLAHARDRNALEWKTYAFPAPPQPSALDAALLAAGFTTANPERLMYAPVTLSEALSARGSATHSGVEVRQVTTLDDLAVFLDVGASAFGKREAWLERSLTPVVRDGSSDTRLFVTFVDGVPACSGRVQVFGPIGFLFGGGSVPGLRRRGAYRKLVAARMVWAAREGCTHVVSECSPDSEAVLTRVGFTDAGPIRRWWKTL